MNLFEAGVLPSVPLGAIAGGILCKSYGVIATVGGVFAGGISGFLAGWLYAYFVMFLMAVFAVFWNGARGHIDPPEPTPEKMKSKRQTAILGIIVGALLWGFIGFGLGLPLVFFIIFLTAVFATWLSVARGQPNPIGPNGMMNRVGALGIFFGILCGGYTGFTVGWHNGLLLVFLCAIVTAYFAIVGSVRDCRL